jgi:far upstream element-binding protein
MSEVEAPVVESSQIAEVTVEDSGNVKRKRSIDETGENGSTDTDSKKNKLEDATPTAVEESAATVSDVKPVLTAAPAAATTAAQPVSAPEVTYILEVAQEKVGQIIGSRGDIIQDIQNRSGAKALVDQKFPDGVPRKVHLTGTAAQVKVAADLIQLIVEQGPTAIHSNSLAGGPTMNSMLECSKMQVGKIIGTKGAVIKDLQSRSGARIQIDQSIEPCKISITGTAPAVTSAVNLLQQVMAGMAAELGIGQTGYNPGSGGGGGGGMYGPGAGAAAGGGYGAAAGMGMAPLTVLGGASYTGPDGKHYMEVPKNFCGKIIGRGGETVTLMQRKTGAHVTVDQSVPEGMPCKAVITGNPHAQSLIVSMINEILSGVPTEQIGRNIPMMGSGGGGMGGGQQYGGGGGMGHGGAPYGGGGGMMNPYGMQGQPQPYGGGGPYGSGMAPGQMMGGGPQAGMYGGGGYGGGYPPQQQGMPMQQSAYGMGGGGIGGYPGAATGAYGNPAAAVGVAAGQMGGYPVVAGGPQAGYGVPQQAGVAMGMQQQRPGYAGAAVAQVNAGPKPVVAASPWTEHKTDEGVSYWYNSQTGTSQVCILVCSFLFIFVNLFSFSTQFFPNHHVTYCSGIVQRCKWTTC